jgi:hypothetical protein
MPLIPDGDAFLLSTPRSADERMSFGLLYNGRALAIRSDNGTEWSRVFTP